MLTNINNISGIFSLLIKIFVIIGTIIYAIFASIVVKQATSLSKNIRDFFNGAIITAAYIHLILAIILVLFAILVL
jgi:hypothetical protein